MLAGKTGITQGNQSVIYASQPARPREYGKPDAHAPHKPVVAPSPLAQVNYGPPINIKKKAFQSVTHDGHEAK